MTDQKFINLPFRAEHIGSLLRPHELVPDVQNTGTINSPLSVFFELNSIVICH